jgi:hypothetical protein
MSEMCTICGASFGSAADLMTHRRTDHKDADPTSDVQMNPEAHTPGFLCAMCGQRFPTAQALAAHNLHPPPLGRVVRKRLPSAT